MSRDCQEMPLDDDPLDFTYAFEALVWVSDLGGCYTEIACVLEPNEMTPD